MVRAVAGRPVAVAPAVVARQQPVQGGHGIDLRPGPELDHDDPRRRVRDEDVEQPVTALGRVGGEPGAGGRQVREAAGAAGPDLELEGAHGSGEDRAERAADPAQAAAARRGLVVERVAHRDLRGAPPEQADGRRVGRVLDRVDEAADPRRAGDPDRHLEDLAAELRGAGELGRAAGQDDPGRQHAVAAAGHLGRGAARRSRASGTR